MLAKVQKKHTGPEGLVVSEGLDVVEELRRAGHTGVLDDVGDDLAERLLAEDLVDVGDFVRNILVHDDAAGGRFDQLLTLRGILLVDDEADVDLGVHVDGLLVVGHDDFFGGVEILALTLGAGTDLGDV